MLRAHCRGKNVHLRGGPSPLGDPLAKEFIVTIENRPGTLADVTKALGQANVNILGIALQATGDFGTLRFVPSDEAKTEKALKSGNFRFVSHEVVTVKAKHAPGELARFAEKLSKSGINIDAVYPVVQPGTTDVEVAFRVSDVASARKVLGA